MTYQETLTYLDSFIDYERVPFYDYKKSVRLNRMQRFLKALGNPHKDLRAIHISGTKGKGSTAAMVSSILREAGLKTGLYTSPHLISFRERIKINGEEIAENELSGTLDEMRPVIERLGKKEKPTFFEVYTALAFLYFRKMKTDFVVLEAGMGGRLDATNAVDAKISAVTPISFEHTQKLGNSLREIAYEKSGIIKNHALCITSLQEGEALKVIEDVCRRKNAKLLCVGRDIIFEEGPFSDERQHFRVWGRFGEYHNLGLKLLGQHQIVNAAVAIGIVESLRTYGVIIPHDVIKRGFLSISWPGRIELAVTDPRVVLDGAQNAASAEALAAAIKRHFIFKNVILILAVSSDKDNDGI